MDITKIKHNLTQLFCAYFGNQPMSFSEISGSGSDRCYYRISDDNHSAIGVYGRDRGENVCFIELSKIFRGANINVPAIYAESPDNYFYIQEDLGNDSLFARIQNSDESDIRDLIKKCMGNLANIQVSLSESDYNILINKEFSERNIKWDLNYFKYEYLKPAGIMFNENDLEDDFESLCKDLLSINKKYWCFMYRDCQSRNVIINNDEPWWIDYQGGRFGPGLYDAISFLWQAKADFSDQFRDDMLHEYAHAFCSRREGACVDELLSYSSLYILFRTLQVLGAYGFRGLVENRAHFVESIPYALKNLFKLIHEESLNKYPELLRVCVKLVDDQRFNFNQQSNGLTVKVFSFSYKKGYPSDYSGNGGGFIFDCRAMHNPGRYTEYKNLTGRDIPVQQFLEERGEVQSFLASAKDMVNNTVKRYLQRGFSSLQVGFGCTGGQHRSVYCAEKLAHHLKKTFPQARIELIHREQKIETVL